VKRESVDHLSSPFLNNVTAASPIPRRCGRRDLAI
jgi:hypothetical protein